MGGVTWACAPPNMPLLPVLEGVGVGRAKVPVVPGTVVPGEGEGLGAGASEEPPGPKRSKPEDGVPAPELCPLAGEPLPEPCPLVEEPLPVLPEGLPVDEPPAAPPVASPEAEGIPPVASPPPAPPAAPPPAPDMPPPPPPVSCAMMRKAISTAVQIATNCRRRFIGEQGRPYSSLLDHLLDLAFGSAENIFCPLFRVVLGSGLGWAWQRNPEIFRLTVKKGDRRSSGSGIRRQAACPGFVRMTGRGRRAAGLERATGIEPA